MTNEQYIPPTSLNPKLAQRPAHQRLKSAEAYVKGILQGDRITLSRAITLAESTRQDHQKLAQQIIEQCLPKAGNSVRIGITGTPGVGKSTFIEALGLHLLEQERRIAVLTIDPSSQVSRGSILGDKTRMGELSNHEQVFIRPSAAGETLGGVARKTRETILLCEAAGFDTIFIETVGVGQSEIAVHSMVDCFLLLLLPGAGDELQGIKRGIVEMADIVAVNKADGERLALAKQARQEYRNALHLFPAKESGWTPKVHLCSATDKSGISEVWESIQTFVDFTQENDFFNQNRSNQARYWLHETIQHNLGQWFYQHQAIKKALPEIEDRVLAGQLSSFQGAEELLELFTKAFKK